MRPPFPASGHADPKSTCQKSIHSRLASVQSPKQRTSHRLQPIRRKEEGEEQKYNPADGGGVKNRAIPSTARITEAIVSRKAQISNRNTSRAARRDSTRAKGATNIFSSIFIIKTSFILSISILSCLPGDINVAKD